MEILENEKFGGKRKIVIIERRAKERFTRMKRKDQHRHISKKEKVKFNRSRKKEDKRKSI